MVELLTIEQVAERLQLNKETVRRWLLSGELKGSKIGGRLWRVSVDDLINYLEENSNAN